MSQRVVPWIGAVMLACSLHCTSGEEGSDPSSAAGTAENNETAIRNFCVRYAEITCEAADGCNCLNEDPPELCRTRQEAFCWDDVGSAVAVGRMTFDASTVEPCLEEIESEWSSCFSEKGPWPEACLDLSAGVMAEGDACDDNRECVAPLACWGGVCTRVPVEGEACLDGLCGDGLFCTEDDQCERPGSSGAACVEGDLACASGHYCDPRTLTCERFLADGDSCTHTASACDADAYCSDMDWTCQRAPDVGESCEASGGVCGQGAYCDGSRVCQAKLAPGAACAGDDDCLSERCDDDECGIVVGSVCGY